ncbi:MULTISPECIES: hypothetical protein [Ruminobacter]|uniref:Uncharacterized protein n=1 Tax=Ruminobacter amylophilus TaxID=867 RepID=A0A662ZG23_9GAMM|nr:MULTISPECIES: hypothetical protein [Ruminobacter]MBO6010045.1 hypothetical protein [Ruminobacter sp.]MBP3749175.1 hypothetical protein [Ruminobacter sp.]MBQ3776173.1 hypothetical protein [Ruminobacter sp.]SFP01506.1 hypothetical protein SAMN02910344_00194 [Ruminobacter amylophilus]
MKRGLKLSRFTASRLSKHRVPSLVAKRRNRQRRHVLYTIHFEKTEV